MSSAWSQVRALLALRWQMARTPGVRLALCLAGLLVGWLLVLGLRAAGALDAAVLETAVELAPEAYLGFLVLAVVAPLTAGGGSDVLPADQLVAFPVRPQTQYVGGLLLAPLNLVWVVQALVLAVETSCLTAGGSLAPGVVTSLAYAVLATLVGQALAWCVVGLRQTRAGRRAVLALGGALTVAVALVVHAGAARDALDHSPTRLVVRAVVAGGAGELGPWVLVTTGLVCLAALALQAGLASCAWALRRPTDGGPGRDGRDVPRRGPRPSVLRELVAVDRASVWRAPALRRGGLVLALLPGVASAGAQVPWSSLVVLPGLVAAGSGLLFGVNAFALDGSGALWLASLPVDPALRLRAKLQVIAETVLAAVALTIVTGAVRAPVAPRPAELAAVLASAAACTAVVVSTGLHLSLSHPHRADLRGPRDAVAPPGALVMASIRLSVPTTVTGLALAAAAASDRWEAPLALAVPVVLLSARSVRRSLARWADPAVRGRVASVVSAG